MPDQNMPDQFDRLKAALADHYAIERELGEGGMAIVYLARDLKHDRLVAVKVLRPELAAALGAERFLREIQITAKLSHPHILPLYDSGEAGGFLYYVMPFVEGESLADLITREQQLSIDEAIRITREVAEALAHAHSYGLVHRDIKPLNILLSGGHAVVADFGIARAVSAAGGEKLTQTGMAVGTPHYMSPEQAGGEQQLDGRSDIYSLGCMLYEMLVGQIPFTGPTPQAIMARHSMDAVPPLHIVRQTIPDELEDVVLCALAKLPADRFRTATEFAEALQAVATGQVPHLTKSRITRRARRPETPRRAVLVAAAAAVLVGAGWTGWQFWLRAPGSSPGIAAGLDPHRVAVLYFEDRTPGSELGHVADGLTEGLINELSQVRALDVISRNGVAPYRGLNVSRDSIARALGAGSLVEGSVEQIGDRLRVTTRLVDGVSGADFDRASFELPAGEFLAAQDSLTQVISRILRERLGEEIRLRGRQAGTSSIAAWGLVQRAERVRKDAEALLEEDDPSGAFQAFQRSDSILARAEAADPQWVEPIVLRGQIAYRRARLVLGADPLESVRWIDSGMGYAQRALALDRNDAEAFELRGSLRYIHYLLGVTPDPAEAESLLTNAREDLEAAVQADPSLAGAHSTLSHLYYQIDDDVVSAILAARRAYEEDAYLSVAPDILKRLFFGSYDVEQFTQARRWCTEGHARFPEDFRFVECQLWLMTTPAVEPDAEAAWRLLDELTALAPEPVREIQRHRAMMAVGGILARADLADSARAVLLRARAGADVDPAQELPFFEAFMRTLLGDYDEAIRLLKQYGAAGPGEEESGETGGELYWWWRDLQDHPQFEEVLWVIK